VAAVCVPSAPIPRLGTTDQASVTSRHSTLSPPKWGGAPHSCQIIGQRILSRNEAWALCGLGDDMASFARVSLDTNFALEATCCG
jgi:hypothetical protein